MSALLLQLVQTSAHDVRMEAESLRDSRLQALALRRQDSASDVGPTFLNEKDMEVSVAHMPYILLFKCE